MQVAIHAGAAFTDEGHLLTSLLANASAMSDRSVVPLTAQDGRLFVKTMSDALAQDVAISVAGKKLAETLPDDPEVERAIVSSDKFFGPRRTALLNGQIYPFAGQRTAYTQQLLEGTKIELFFGLANPGFFIPKVLMSLHKQNRDAILRSTDLSCLSWLSMIEDLTDLAPDVQLTLWANEDTPLIWGDVVRAISGLPDDAPLEDEYALATSLLTNDGQRKFAAMISQVGVQSKEALQNALAKTFEDHVRPELIEEEIDLPGWTSDVIAAFSELYEQDLEKIETMPNVRFLKAPGDAN